MNMRRYALVACVLLTGCGTGSQTAKQIEERDKQIAALKWDGMQLAKRKSELQAARRKDVGKETPSQAAGWKAKLGEIDAQLKQNDADMRSAERERAEELGR